MNKEATEKWNECLALIRRELNDDAAYAAWFEPAVATGLEGSTLELTLPSKFFEQLYEEKYFPVLSEALRAVLGRRVAVKYRYPDPAKTGRRESAGGGNRDGAKGGKPADKNKPAANAGKGTQAPPTVGTGTGAQAEFMPKLNEDLSFENFCVGTPNKIAWTIAESIASKPLNSHFNPFFIYGDVGVGKTHLMQAIGLKVRREFPDMNVVFLPMREFQRLYQNAYLQDRIPAFLNWFMRCDVLLFDDLQEISGSKGTLNNALFPIFNHLHLHGKQLVFTCDRPPQDLHDLEDRLIDRFKWGSIEKLERPDAALRKKILTFKAKKNEIDIPKSVIDFVAKAPLNSVREIESVVLGIMTRAITLGREITLDMAREVINRAVRHTTRKALNFDMIVETVAERYNLNSDVLFTKSRVKDVAEARMVIMYLGQRMLGLSTGSIGRKLGRQHSTVIHGIQSVNERIGTDREFAEKVADLERSL